eukprot:jgi/Botrbrau1/9508/Bobra.0252s0123.1
MGCSDLSDKTVQIQFEHPFRQKWTFSLLPMSKAYKCTKHLINSQPLAPNLRLHVQDCKDG